MRTDTERQTDERRDEANSQFFFSQFCERPPQQRIAERFKETDGRTDGRTMFKVTATFTLTRWDLTSVRCLLEMFWLYV
jgi:hypothetical protein